MTWYRILKRNHVIRASKDGYYQKLFPCYLLILRLCSNVALDCCPDLKQVRLWSMVLSLLILYFCSGTGLKLKN